MQDDLQKAYQAYQQALYLLPNPKVGLLSCSTAQCLTTSTGGPETVVWHWHSL